MRPFIAIDLPEKVKKQVIDIQKKLNIGRLSFPKPEALHLTLLFLGNIEESGIETLKQCLQKVKFEKFDLKTTKTAFLGNKNYLRVIYLDLEESKELQNLVKKIDSAVKSFNIKRDFPFKAHITIARIKILIPQERKKIRILVSGINRNLEENSFGVSEFRLYSSKLTREGPVYSIVDTVSGSS